MDTIFLGILGGMLASCLVAVTLLNVWTNTHDRRVETACVIFGWVFAFFAILTGACIGTNADKHTNQQYIEQYIVTKQLIEESVTNGDLSGFEKAELVKQAADENKVLVAKQYASQQWYGLTIPDEIMELTPINLTQREVE